MLRFGTIDTKHIVHSAKMPPKFVVQTNCHIIVKIAGKLPNQFYSLVTTKIDQKVQGYVTNITETVEEGKPSIITSVLVETAVFADCHFLQEAVENSERVTNSAIEDLYADGA